MTREEALKKAHEWERQILDSGRERKTTERKTTEHLESKSN